MAIPKNAAGDVANKKMKGLKDHKKTQKEKTLAKRTAAAEKAKVKKTLSAPVAVAVAQEVAPAHEDAVGDVETASMTKMLNPNAKEFSVAKVKAARKDKVASKKPTNAMMVPEQPFDIVAYRKALEAELYDNMETPRQMLIRCRYTIPIDAEYHPVDEDEFADKIDCSYDCEFDEAKPIVQCLDDNRFEIEPTMTGLTEDDMTTRTDVTPSLSLYRLFGMVKDAGQAKVGISNSLLDSSVSRAPDSDEPTEFDEIIVNLPREGRRPRGPVFMGHLSSIAHARVISPVVSRTLESVEAEMRLAANNNASNAPAFVGPAIVGFKVKQQDPDNVNEDDVTTGLTTIDRTDETNVLKRLLGFPIKTQQDLSPTSSHHSRTSSPVDPQRANTPLTSYSISPPSGLPVWTTPYNAPSYYAFPDGAVSHSPHEPIHRRVSRSARTTACSSPIDEDCVLWKLGCVRKLGCDSWYYAPTYTQ